MKSVKFARFCLFCLLLCRLSAAAASGGPDGLPDDYCRWEMADFGIAQPLCGLDGDPAHGQAIATDSRLGNCLACHRLPVEGIEAYGTIGPPLAGIGARLGAPQIRLRVVDSRHLNPLSIMPGYYRDPRLIHRPGKDWVGKTFLTAQQVEDVVAWLVTLQ